MTSKYIIGIDLGTTNCSLAYLEKKMDDKIPCVEQFAIDQVVLLGEQEKQFLLPSFFYFPFEEEKERHLTAPSWDEKRDFTVGALAQSKSEELPTRVISSAKSWLCHRAVDRKSALLPLEADENILKKSPVEVLKCLLEHLKETWDLDPLKEPFQNQKILITVPASFDPDARQLVEEAAQQAGYPEILLLEEPQAAFYAWLLKEHDSWRKKLSVGDSILVVDIGGGTTDFSYIQVEEESGCLILKRKAVGEHLLLGGDNMDWALTYFVKQKFESQGKQIEETRLQELKAKCRRAKEELLKEKNQESYTVTLQGRGSKLIGGSMSVELFKEEVLHFLIDGFIPIIELEEASKNEANLGLKQFGLPYAKDARISCQLAKFLSQIQQLSQDSSLQERELLFPTHILFNGGVLKPKALQNRFEDILNHWATILKKKPVIILEPNDLDFAVSKGAAYYGYLRESSGLRIKAGISRSYFIGIETSRLAIPGIEPQVNLLCVAPFGMEEGSSFQIQDREFSLLVGEYTSFRFFSYSQELLPNGLQVCPGMLIPYDKAIFKELSPIETLLDKGAQESTYVRVNLQSTITELGALQIACVSKEGQKWILEFSTRS